MNMICSDCWRIQETCHSMYIQYITNTRDLPLHVYTIYYRYCYSGTEQKWFLKSVDIQEFLPFSLALHPCCSIVPGKSYIISLYRSSVHLMKLEERLNTLVKYSKTPLSRTRCDWEKTLRYLRIWDVKVKSLKE